MFTTVVYVDTNDARVLDFGLTVPLPRSLAERPRLCSAEAVDRHSHRVANLVHPLVAQTAEPFGEFTDRDALDRIEVHC